MVNKKMAPGQKQSKKKPVVTDNFLEALRGLGGGVVDSAVNDVVKGVGKTAIEQLTGRKRRGELKPNQALTFEKSTQELSRERVARNLHREFWGLRQQERLVFSRAEENVQLQIKAILEELKKLADSTKHLAKEVKIAAKQAPVAPGVYHYNFFERLRQTILLFKKRVEDATTWLAVFNRRVKKQPYYWAQVRKSGTKFMLSQERYMATQAA